MSVLYGALNAETEEFGTVLKLTLERDWQGLIGLFFLDAAIGTIYGAVIGLVLGILNMKGLEPPENRHTEKSFV